MNIEIVIFRLFYKGKLCDGVTAEDRLPVLVS